MKVCRSYWSRNTASRLFPISRKLPARIIPAMSSAKQGFVTGKGLERDPSLRTFSSVTCYILRRVFCISSNRPVNSDSRQDCLDLDVVPGKDLNQHYPEFVIQYYESCVPFSVRHKIGRVPRIAPEVCIFLFLLFE